MIYIDNILLAAPSPAVASRHNLLQSLGFIINWKKSSLTSKQTLEHWGE